MSPSRESEQLWASPPFPAPYGLVSSLSPWAQWLEDAGPTQIRAGRLAETDKEPG